MKIIPNENTFKTQFIYISCIKYFITQTKIFKIKVRFKMPVKQDLYFGTEGVVFLVY